MDIVIGLCSGLSLSWSVLVGPDQHWRGKNEIRPAKSKQKKLGFFWIFFLDFFLGKEYTDWHISSKIG